MVKFGISASGGSGTVSVQINSAIPLALRRSTAGPTPAVGHLSTGGRMMEGDSDWKFGVWENNAKDDIASVS